MFFGLRAHRLVDRALRLTVLATVLRETDESAEDSLEGPRLASNQLHGALRF
jgi:hypothetical protein